MKPKALIYCRVSSQRQVNEGHGLDSQEKRCRDYADNKGYEVTKVFLDEGISGGLFERPAMKELISFLDKNPFERYVVVFDDLPRFARGLSVHLKLKTELVGRGAKLECLNFNFEDSPEGEFIENVLASKAQLDREQNRRQVMQKMKARLEAGYWPFHPPPAFVHVKDPVHGKLLVRSEPIASIYKQAIESFACGSLISKEDVREYVQTQFNKCGIKGKLGNHAAEDILKQVLYAGYVEHDKWGVGRRKGHHEGFISLETYELAQQRLQERSKPRLRADYSADFPLRLNVLCGECGKPYTASFNKGRKKHYPNYWCKTKECRLRYKTISKNKLESEFEALLRQIKPANEVLDLAKEVFNEVWNTKLAQSASVLAFNQKQIGELEGKVQSYIERIGKTQDEEMVSLYEEEIRKVRQKIRELEGHSTQNYTDKNFGIASHLVLDTLKEPLQMWNSDSCKDKQTILSMYFDEPLKYFYDSGFGTVQLARPIELINDFVSEQNPNVEMEGFEPSSEKA